MDIVEREWVVEVDADIADSTLWQTRHGYFEINVRNGKAGGLLM